VHNDASGIMTKLGCFYSVFKNDLVEGKISSCISTRMRIRVIKYIPGKLIGVCTNEFNKQ